MPRQRLSADRIIEGAIELADREGIDAVTMRRLGTALGVEAMSLYRYVPTKDALLDAMVDAIVAKWVAPTPSALTGRDAIAEVMHEAHGVLLAHTWAVDLLSTRPRVGPGRLRYAERVISLLLEDGFTPALTHSALHIVDGAILGFSAQDARRPTAEAMGDVVDRLFAGDLSEEYPGITATIREHHDHHAEYALMVDVIVDGLWRLRGDSARS